MRSLCIDIDRTSIQTNWHTDLKMKGNSRGLPSNYQPLCINSGQCFAITSSFLIALE